MREYFRGVIWPRQPIKEYVKENYRYTIVGILITDKPIENFDGNEFLLDGNVEGFGIARSLSQIDQKQPAFRIGDANGILLTLDRLVEED